MAYINKTVIRFFLKSSKFMEDWSYLLPNNSRQCVENRVQGRIDRQNQHHNPSVHITGYICTGKGYQTLKKESQHFISQQENCRD